MGRKGRWGEGALRRWGDEECGRKRDLNIRKLVVLMAISCLSGRIVNIG